MNPKKELLWGLWVLYMCQVCFVRHFVLSPSPLAA